MQALRAQLKEFHGVVLDVGSGDTPYKPLLLALPSRAKKYIALDIEHSNYQKPDFVWDGVVMPFDDKSVDCAFATEVLEHCPVPEIVLRETLRVLKPGGFFFFTVPFLWLLHCVPHDEYRYTPFALTRHLQNVGFEQIKIKAHGGWDISLAQMIGLWVRRRPMSERKQKILSRLAFPIVRSLAAHDKVPPNFPDRMMQTGVSVTARKPA